MIYVVEVKCKWEIDEIDGFYGSGRPCRRWSWSLSSSGVDDVEDEVERELLYGPALLDLTVASNGSLRTADEVEVWRC
jgi:hypothetical protein